jgi:hypothetical protein
MPLPRWSVRLLIAEGEAGPISGVMATGEGVRELSIGRGPIQVEDEPDAITFEIEAATADDARVRCQHRLGEFQRAVGLSVRQAPVVWVARLSDEPASSIRFLAEAESLVGDERFEMAVIAAQIHLEVQVRVLVEATAEARSSPVLDAVIAGQARWAPHERWLHPILDALLGVEIARADGWGEYMAHVSRRNAVAHRGQTVDDASARASIVAVSRLWLWLNGVARAASTGGPV